VLIIGFGSTVSDHVSSVLALTWTFPLRATSTNRVPSRSGLQTTTESMSTCRLTFYCSRLKMMQVCRCLASYSLVLACPTYTLLGNKANEISVDDERSTSFLEAVPMGTLKPGETACKVVRLLNRHSPGNRLLDLSVRSSPHLLPREEGSSQTEEEPSVPSTTTAPTPAEHLRTVSIPVVHPFHCTFEPSYRRGPSRQKAGGKARRRPLDLEEPTVWDDAGRAIVHAMLGCFGPWPVQVTSIELSVSVCRL
jgi:hypothetical protein